MFNIFSVLPPVLVPRQSQLPPMMFRQMPENLQYNYNQGPNSPSSSPPPNSPFQSSALSGKYIFKLINIIYCV